MSTTTHTTAVDVTDADVHDTAAYRAFCTCGWAATLWQHVNDDPDDDDPDTAAYDAALSDGDQHLADPVD